MRLQPKVSRHEQLEHRYRTVKYVVEQRRGREQQLKAYYFQLFSGLNTVIAYYRYSWETRDSKAGLHNLCLRDSMSDADVTVAP